MLHVILPLMGSNKIDIGNFHLLFALHSVQWDNTTEWVWNTPICMQWTKQPAQRYHLYVQTMRSKWVQIENNIR